MCGCLFRDYLITFLRLKKVSQEESVSKSILPAGDTSKMNSSNKSSTNHPTITRKNSRFSQITVDPMVFASQQKPVVDLYSDDHDDNQSSSSLNPDSSLKKNNYFKNFSTIGIDYVYC